MTEQETTALLVVFGAMYTCNNPLCSSIAAQAQNMTFTYMDDDWDCVWYDDGCSGEWFGGDEAWVSRSGGDGISNADWSASTAWHEAVHYALGTSDETITQAIAEGCYAAAGL